MTTSLSERVIKKTLPNGLTVLVVEDHAAPIVAVNVWFGVGSVHETDEMNGLAHFQEHMVFKGTRKYGVGEIANIVKSAGGNLNAGTSYSYTMYYIVLPSREFATALEVQSDAMMNSTFDPEEFKKERLVVIDEARMYDDRPESFTFYRTMELGFREHTYRRPIAGYQPVVEKITRDQLLDFYGNYYRPGNAVLVVVGDVVADDALRRIEDVYGAWKPRRVVTNEPPVEPPQDVFRFHEYRGTMDHGYLGAGFHVPSILHDDYPVLEMISALLGAGRSSRLYRRVLEEKRLVTSVRASVLAERWPGLFLVMASMPPGKWGAARDAVFGEFERLKHEPVPADELEKVRRQLERSLYSDLETMEGQASTLGYYHLLGDYRLGDAHRKAIAEVDPGRIVEVARRYFHPDNCALVAYRPEGAEALDEAEVAAAMRRTLSRDGGVTDVRGGAPVTEPEDTAPAARRSGTAATDRDVELITLANGVRVLLKERHTLPMVSMLTTFPGGGRFEPRGKSGIALVTHRALVKGTRSYSAEEIVERVESLGGSIDSFADFDTGGVAMSLLSAHVGDALPVYRDVLRAPAFDPDRVAYERTKALEELAKRHDNPVQLAMDELFARVFGEHPYAHPFLGDPGEVEGIGAEDCSAWYSSLLVPGHIVLALVGDITRDEGLAAAEMLLGDLPEAPPRASAPRAPEAPIAPGEHVLRRKDLRQAVTFVGYTAPPMLTAEAVALEVLNGALTGLGGRLFVELRDKRSLGYMTGSACHALFEGGIFFGYANPNAAGIDEAVAVIQHELDKVTRETITGDELARSKEWLIGTQQMQLQRNGSQAHAYGRFEALGFGYDVVDRVPGMVAAVTAEAARAAAQKVFVPERAVVVKLLPE